MLKCTRYDLVIVGAGLAGVFTAYWAQQQGLSVCVVDRREGPALETSFANGGQVAVSYAEPWANPAMPLKVLKWLVRGDGPLEARLTRDPAQWSWALRFLGNCAPFAAKTNLKALTQLALYSRECLAAARDAETIDYAARFEGILHVYRKARLFDHAAKTAETMRAAGCDRQAISRSAALKLEPALATGTDEIVGATYTKDDESGDARMFAEKLAGLVAERGALFRFGAACENLEQDGQGIAVHLSDGETIGARNAALCCGPESGRLAAAFGVRLPVYPIKGHSISVPIEGANGAPVKSITDEENKLVFSNLGTHLRVAGGAGFGGWNVDVEEKWISRIRTVSERLFPDAGRYDRLDAWAGLRPMTPSGRPYIGAARRSGLWVNTGHGTLGWTLAAGSGKLLADMIATGKSDLGPAASGEAPFRAA